MIALMKRMGPFASRSVAADLPDRGERPGFADALT